MPSLADIHPSAHVSPEATIGDGVRVGPGAVIEAGAKVGDGTTIMANAVVTGYATIGRNCRIHYSACIGGDPQDLSFPGADTRVDIGDGTVVREFATVHRATKPGAATTVGRDCYLMVSSHVAHDCVLGDKIVMSNCATLGGHVELGDWVILGGLSAVHQFTKVGAHCFIANNTAVTRDVPPYIMAVGQPAEPHSVNSEGLKRRGFSAVQIRNIKNAYRLLYRQGLKLKDALVELERRATEQPELTPFIDFIKLSSRSIVR